MPRRATGVQANRPRFEEKRTSPTCGRCQRLEHRRPDGLGIEKEPAREGKRPENQRDEREGEGPGDGSRGEQGPAARPGAAAAPESTEAPGAGQHRREQQVGVVALGGDEEPAHERHRDPPSGSRGVLPGAQPEKHEQAGEGGGGGVGHARLHRGVVEEGRGQPGPDDADRGKDRGKEAPADEPRQGGRQEPIEHAAQAQGVSVERTGAIEGRLPPDGRDGQADGMPENEEGRLQEGGPELDSRVRVETTVQHDVGDLAEVHGLVRTERLPGRGEQGDHEEEAPSQHQGRSPDPVHPAPRTPAGHLAPQLAPPHPQSEQGPDDQGRDRPGDGRMPEPTEQDTREDQQATSQEQQLERGVDPACRFERRRAFCSAAGPHGRHGGPAR